jgi:hypothetical protein
VIKPRSPEVAPIAALGKANRVDRRIVIDRRSAFAELKAPQVHRHRPIMYKNSFERMLGEK